MPYGWLIPVISLMVALPAQGETYRCQDANGNTVSQGQPCDGSKGETIDIQTRSPSGNGPDRESGETAESEQGASRDDAEATNNPCLTIDRSAEVLDLGDSLSQVKAVCGSPTDVERGDGETEWDKRLIYKDGGATLRVEFEDGELSERGLTVR